MLPNLIDTNSKHYIKSSLMEMHDNKMKNYTYLFNISIFFIFCIGVTVTLYYLYKGKISDEEKAIRSFKEKQQILSKLRALQEEQFEKAQITSLPPISTIHDYQ